MRAGDIKKFLEEAISATSRDSLSPVAYDINDPFLLRAIKAYKEGSPPEHLEALIDGAIQTEKLSVDRRIAVLHMVKAILCKLSKKSITPEERNRLRDLLYSYYI